MLSFQNCYKLLQFSLYLFQISDTPVDENGNTQAMIYALNNQFILQEYFHNPKIQNKNGDTVAMIMAKHNMTIDKQWYHDPNIKNNQGYTVALIYAKNGIIPTQEWYHDKFVRVKQYQSVNKFVPKIRHFLHYKQIRYCTVQNFLERFSIKVPEYWKYDNTVDNEDNTQAMLQAKEGKIPEKDFYHDKMQTNKLCESVAMILSDQGIIPPQEWIYDIDFSFQGKYSIRENMYFNGYIYKNNQFILNYHILTINDYCQCCEEQQKQFVQTQCQNKICFNCFKEFLRNNDIETCPICCQKDWVKAIYPTNDGKDVEN